VPEFSLQNGLQVLILVGGIYLVLSLLRTTRGSSLVRGLGIALLIFGVGMYSLVRTLHLDELEQVLDAIFGVVIIMLVVLFQPELRRGILRLGEHGLLSKILGKDAQEALGEITAAVAAMARKKQGALIAIERQTPLDQYIEKGVHLDSAVDALLLDSIFHNKGALHDGAVIIRGDRIVAAAAILPLSENSGLAKTTGTRHRAALGLAEETDAVTVVVSEESGWISVANDGSMLSRISSNALEDVLKERLGKDPENSVQKLSPRKVIERFFKEHWGQKLIALALGLALFIAAHEKVTETLEFQVQVQNANPGDPVGVPMAELLSIHPPRPEPGKTTELHILEPTPRASYTIAVSGSRAQMQELSGGIGGVLELTTANATDRTLSPDEFRWGAGRPLERLRVRWVGEEPQLRLQTFERRVETPKVDQVHLVRGNLASYLDFDPKTLRFRPNQIEVRGPSDLFEGGSEPFALSFADVEVGASNGGTWSGPLTLSKSLLDAGFELMKPLYLEVDLNPRFERLAEIRKDVVLVSFNPTLPDPLERFERPDQPVRIVISVIPLLDQPSEEDRTSLSIALREYIQAHTYVFVDVDRPRPAGSTKAQVELRVLKDDGWLQALPPALQERIQQRDDFPFQVELHPDDTTLWLSALPGKEDPAPAENSTNPSDGLDQD